MRPMDMANAECTHVASGDVRASVNAFLTNFQNKK
jgi:hypothetical protein